MQPLVVQQPLLLLPLEGSYVLWIVLEVTREIRQSKRFRAGVQRQDRGSHAVLIGLIVLGLALCATLAFVVPATAITSARELFFWLGILLVYVGIAVRRYAIKTLGASFTTVVATASEQHIVEAGPYKLIRHPAYTGLLITLIGFGLCYTNWLSLLALMGCLLLGFSYRIHVEERALQERFGQRYQEYMQRTKRLIPFVM
jgi:protein-S-isoprenylcysteine O-methyltransferase Ste14